MLSCLVVGIHCFWYWRSTSCTSMKSGSPHHIVWTWNMDMQISWNGCILLCFSTLICTSPDTILSSPVKKQFDMDDNFIHYDPLSKNDLAMDDHFVHSCFCMILSSIVCHLIPCCLVLSKNDLAWMIILFVMILCQKMIWQWMIISFVPVFIWSFPVWYVTQYQFI